MALEKLTDNVEIHQTLGDTPNSEGMTAADLKAKFDQAAKIIKQFINDRIVPNALDKRGDTMKGVLRLGGNRIADLPEPEEENDAANKAYVDTVCYPAHESAEHPGCYYRIVDGVTEWINPPVVLGVEYRTTERFSGMPVYTKFVQLGVTASGQSIVQWHDASVSPIRHACRFTSQTLPFLNDDNTILVNVRLVSNDAYILCNSNWVISSSSQIQMQVWYYK